MMDPEVELELFIEKIKRQDVPENVKTVVHEALGETSIPLLPLDVPDSRYNSHPQAMQNMGGGYYGCTPMGAGPHIYEQPSMAAQCFYPMYDQNCIQCHAQLFSHGGAYGQAQHFPYQPEYGPGAAAVSSPPSPPPPPHPYISTMMLPNRQDMELPLVGVMNGGAVYGVPSGLSFTPLPPAESPQIMAMSKKCTTQQDEKLHYIKRPPNAFLVFMREERAKVVFERHVHSAKAHTILGRKWKSMSHEEQAKYYKLAREERRLHALQFPQWSGRDNYGKKKKKFKRKFLPLAEEESADEPDSTLQPGSGATASPLCVGLQETLNLSSDEREATPLLSLPSPAPNPPPFSNPHFSPISLPFPTSSIPPLCDHGLNLA